MTNGSFYQPRLADFHHADPKLSNMSVVTLDVAETGWIYRSALV